MIQRHQYARHDHTAVYADCGGAGGLLCELHSGQWAGVVEQKEDWIRIVTTTCTGWVLAADMESRPPFQLHAWMTPESKLIFRAQ